MIVFPSLVLADKCTLEEMIFSHADFGERTLVHVNSSHQSDLTFAGEVYLDSVSSNNAIPFQLTPQFKCNSVINTAMVNSKLENYYIDTFLSKFNELSVSVACSSPERMKVSNFNVEKLTLKDSQQRVMSLEPISQSISLSNNVGLTLNVKFDTANPAYDEEFNFMDPNLSVEAVIEQVGAYSIAESSFISGLVYDHEYEVLAEVSVSGLPISVRCSTLVVSLAVVGMDSTELEHAWSGIQAGGLNIEALYLNQNEMACNAVIGKPDIEINDTKATLTYDVSQIAYLDPAAVSGFILLDFNREVVSNIHEVSAELNWSNGSRISINMEHNHTIHPASFIERSLMELGVSHCDFKVGILTKEGQISTVSINDINMNMSLFKAIDHCLFGTSIEVEGDSIQIINIESHNRQQLISMIL